MTLKNVHDISLSEKNIQNGLYYDNIERKTAKYYLCLILCNKAGDFMVYFCLSEFSKITFCLKKR